MKTKHTTERRAAPGGLSPAAYPLLSSQAPRPGDKLTLKNETRWNTADLKRFVRTGLRYLGVSERRTVVIVHRRERGARGSSGLASYGSRWMKVRVPMPDEIVSVDRETGCTVSRLPSSFAGASRVPGLVDGLRSDLRDFANVFLHELEHNLGLRHHQMVEGACRGAQAGRDRGASWIAGLVIRSKPAEIRPSTDERRAALLAARERAARDSLARWERKLALAKTKVAAWRRKVGYYEKRKAACGP